MRAPTAAFVAALVALAGAPMSYAQLVSQPETSTEGKIGPRLSLSSEEVDLGEVDDSAVISHPITLTNTGDQDLEITNVSVTCGCTASEVGQKLLKPGETTELSINFDPRGRSGDQHGKRVTIESNDPTGAKSVGLSVWVLPRVIAEPPVANFGQVLQGEVKTVLLSVKGMTSDFEVLSVTVDREDAFVAKVHKPKTTQREHPRTGETLEVGESIIEISMTDQARVGRIDGGLRVETNDPTSPIVNLRLTAVVAGDIAPEPSRISLNALQPGQNFTETFKLLSTRGRAFTVEKATLVTSTMSAEDRDTLEVTFKPLPAPEPGAEKPEVGYEVTVTGTATDTMRIIQGSVVLLTDAEGQRVVRIPITGVVRVQNAAATPAQGR